LPDGTLLVSFFPESPPDSITNFGNGADSKTASGLGVRIEMSFGFDDFALRSVGGNRACILKDDAVPASELPNGVTACIRCLFDQFNADNSQHTRECGPCCAADMKDGEGTTMTSIAAVACFTNSAPADQPPKGLDARAASILSTFKRDRHVRLTRPTVPFAAIANSVPADYLTFRRRKGRRGCVPNCDLAPHRRIHSGS